MIHQSERQQPEGNFPTEVCEFFYPLLVQSRQVFISERLAHCCYLHFAISQQKLVSFRRTHL
jgi:hypothetical protein